MSLDDVLWSIGKGRSGSAPSSGPLRPSDVRKAVEDNVDAKRLLRTPLPTAKARVEQYAVHIEAGTSLERETHTNMSQIFVVMSGIGTYEYQQPPSALWESDSVKAGDAWVVEAGTPHTILANRGVAMKLLTLYTPPHDEGDRPT